MKISLKRGDVVLEYEKKPMPPERFRAVCRLTMAAIIGGTLLGAIHMIGAWAIAWAAGVLVLFGAYRIVQDA